MVLIYRVQVLVAWEPQNHVVVRWPILVFTLIASGFWTGMEIRCILAVVGLLVSKLVVGRFQTGVAMWLQLLIVLRLRLLIVLQLRLLIVLWLRLLVVVGFLIIDVGLVMIVVVRFLVSDRAPIVVRFSIVVVFIIVAGYIKWSERGGHSTQLRHSVMVEGGRWKMEDGSRVLRGASRLLGAVSHVLHGASRLLRAVSRVGNGFQSGVSMVCWQNWCRWLVFDGLCGGE